MIDLSKFNRVSIGKLFDYAILPKNTQEKDIINGCKEAIAYNCAAIYSSSPYWAPVMKKELAGTDIHIGAAIAFPFGSAPSAVKAFESEFVIKSGCTVLDMPLNVGALKDKNYKVIEQEFKDFISAASGAVTKIILEVYFLTHEEIADACKLIAEAGIDYAKTSSGQFEGPSMEQFLVMRDTLQETKVKLKVSGVKFPRPQNCLCFFNGGG